MGDVLRSYRAMRGDLPDHVVWDTIDLGPVGQGGLLVAGYIEGRWGRRFWFPQQGGKPNALVAGPTRGGKSSLMGAWALTPALQNLYHGTDWAPTVVLDPGGGGSYKVAVAHGAELFTKVDEIGKRLESVLNHVERRRRLLGELTFERVDLWGARRPFTATKVYDLTPEERAKHRMQPMLVVIDELRDLLGEGWEGLSKDERASLAVIRRTFTSIAQKCGAAGIHIAGAVQQPRADILGSFARDQLGARILIGKPDNAQTITMVMGEIEAKKVMAEAEVLGQGHGYAVGLGPDSIVERIYVPEFKLDRYKPLQEGPAGEAAVRDTDAVIAEALETQPGSHSPGGGVFPGGLRGAVAWGVGPAVRWRLRLGALRNFTRPVVEGPFDRDELVRRQAHQDGNGRCAACGRAGQLDVDHVVAFQFGGEDARENVRLLCIRPGRASCHRAKTSAENAVRSARVRWGRSPGPSQRPLALLAVDAVRMRPVDWWGLVAAAAVGFLYSPDHWRLVAAGTLIMSGVVAWLQARGSRLDLRASPDAVLDPKNRRGSIIEYLKAKARRTWRERMTRRHYDRVSWWRFADLYARRWCATFLLSAYMTTILGHAPAVARSVGTFLV